eukprot:4294627-Lingulodinium_polyedra.AAC.1
MLVPIVRLQVLDAVFPANALNAGPDEALSDRHVVSLSLGDFVSGPGDDAILGRVPRPLRLE